MATNRLFTQYNHGGQQALVERLIVEAIRQYGVDVMYIPREYVAKDPIFGEDPLSQFSRVIEIEVYPETVEGFSDNPALASKFGDFMKDEIKFVVSKRRFEEERTENIMTEEGRVLVTDETNVYLHGNTSGRFILEDASRTYADVTQIRPNEGDLIWFPMVGRLFEIKYVSMEKMFYPLGKLNVYNMTCEIMDYSSEKINTGISEIDGIEDDYSHNIQGIAYLTENDLSIVDETGEVYIIDNEETMNTNDKFADNDMFEREGNSFIDFSESDPFSTDQRSNTPTLRSNIDKSDTPGGGSNITVPTDDWLIIGD